METYNSPFSIDELLDALSSSNESVVGPDDIHYQMLKHLPSEVLNTLLSILNDIWLTGNLPSSWRQSYVVPIPKPGKDTSDPTNYRPIALTSCVYNGKSNRFELSPPTHQGLSVKTSGPSMASTYNW